VRFLADENIPGAVVETLAQAGHDISWVRLTAPGIDDRDVLDWAVREDRILLTFDKDFGELARARAAGIPNVGGVVLFRLPTPGPGAAATFVVKAIASRGDWAGHFSVVDPERIRMRPIG
jgi:hypothetical protein